MMFVSSPALEPSAKVQDSHMTEWHVTSTTRPAVGLSKTAMAGAYWTFHHIMEIFSLYVFLSGPGFRVSDFESNTIIGNAQFQGALTLMSQTLSAVTGAVKSVHAYLNMCVSRSFRWAFCINGLIFCHQGQPYVYFAQRDNGADLPSCYGYALHFVFL